MKENSNLQQYEMTFQAPKIVLHEGVNSTISETLLKSSPATFVVNALPLHLPTSHPSSPPSRDGEGGTSPGLASTLYYVDEDTGTFGTIAVDHIGSAFSSSGSSLNASQVCKTNVTEIARNFIRPTRVALSGDTALTRLYDRPVPKDCLLPTSDEASEVQTSNILNDYER